MCHSCLHNGPVLIELYCHRLVRNPQTHPKHPSETSGYSLNQSARHPLPLMVQCLVRSSRVQVLVRLDLQRRLKVRRRHSLVRPHNRFRRERAGNFLHRLLQRYPHHRVHSITILLQHNKSLHLFDHHLLSVRASHTPKSQISVENRLCPPFLTNSRIIRL